LISDNSFLKDHDSGAKKNSTQSNNDLYDPANPTLSDEEDLESTGSNRQSYNGRPNANIKEHNDVDVHMQQLPSCGTVVTASAYRLVDYVSAFSCY
jgi:hypothetical protein